LKGFRSHFHSPFLDFSWRYRNELPPPHRSCLQPLHRQPTDQHPWLRGLDTVSRGVCQFWSGEDMS
jgi:hypothetical protein